MPKTARDKYMRLAMALDVRNCLAALPSNDSNLAKCRYQVEAKFCNAGAMSDVSSVHRGRAISATAPSSLGRRRRANVFLCARYLRRKGVA